MMPPKMAIKVTLAEDGRTPVRQLFFDGVKIGDVSYVEVLEAAMQFVSTLRFEVKR